MGTPPVRNDGGYREDKIMSRLLSEAVAKRNDRVENSKRTGQQSNGSLAKITHQEKMN